MKPNNFIPKTTWRAAVLEELVKPYSGQWGQELSATDTKEMLVLGVGNVTNDGQIDLEGATQRFFTPREHDAIAEEGDLLLVKSSGSAANIRSGKTAICPPELSGRIACSNFMYRLSVKRDLAEPYLLWLILNSPLAKNFVRSVIGASTYPNIKWETYKAFTFPLPPLAEQRRLAASLRAQMAEVERARTAVQAQLDTAQALPGALLRQVFTGNTARRWPCKRIGAVARVQSGYAFKSDWFTDKGIRLLRNVNVAQGKTTWDETAYLPENRRAEFPDFELHEGDIILSLDRPVVAGGLKLTRLTKQDLPALLLQRVGRFVLNDDADANFLHCFLQTDGFIRKITAHDQSLGVPHVSPKQIEATEFPLPNLAEQRQVANRLDAELAAARSLVETLEKRLSEIELLPAALLRSAFSGKN